MDVTGRPSIGKRHREMQAGGRFLSLSGFRSCRVHAHAQQAPDSWNQEAEVHRQGRNLQSARYVLQLPDCLTLVVTPLSYGPQVLYIGRQWRPFFGME